MTDLITAAERAALEPKLVEYERGVLDRVAYFTTFRFGGPFARDRREFPTFAAAQADAKGDRRAMIYAISADDMSAHLCNGAAA